MDVREELEKLKEELKEAEKEVYQAVWPNINDRMDWEHVLDLRQQIIKLRGNNYEKIYTKRVG